MNKIEIKYSDIWSGILCGAVFAAIILLVLTVQILLWCIIPALVYWVSGWFIDDENWRLGFALVTFWVLLLSKANRAGFVKAVENFLQKKVDYLKEQVDTKH